MNVAETRVYQVGVYTVQQRPRFDNPAFAVYIVLLGAKIIGKQFSAPQLSDCEWLRRQQADELVYAKESTFTPYTVNGRNARSPKRANGTR